MKHPPLPSDSNPPQRQLLDVFRYSRRALELVWSTSWRLALVFALLTLVAGVLPAAVAWIGKLIVDGVVAAMGQHQQSGSADTSYVLFFVAAEAGVVALIAGSQRGIATCQALLRALMGQRINLMILEKALTLQLAHFEDSEFYDKLTRARREASTRPLSLVTRTFGLVQNGISLVSYGVLLVQFSPWTVLILLAGGIPEFLAEAKFSGDKFRLFRWRSPETRMQMYLETVLAREDYVKEVKLFRLGPKLIERYKEIFAKLFAEDRRLTLRRDTWGFALGLLGTAAFYGAYAWIALAAIRGSISLGQMTMYLMLFKQGQSAVSASLSAISGMYEDNLYLSNLYEYLEQPVPAVRGELRQGPRPGDGVRFEAVSFSYPGSEAPALQEISLHLLPGDSLALVGENGSGKTTLIKLLTRLYTPDSGRILLDGLDLQEWDGAALRERIGVIFQDFGRYQFLVGENIGAGDMRHFEDRQRWQEAAQKGMASEFIERLPQRYDTQLGKWFKGGRELSGGQWQKIALARAFMRAGADILVLDEPTATMDAAAEATIFEHFRELSRGKMTILISHRFSTVRMADRIVVIDKGRVVEAGSHAELMALGGQYAYLFSLQAEGYR
ncbi:ABC transporter ATP-binding protein [Desulfuromonas carbonis]|uniref:ABC transporter ATP-binding protein n=1 Tax=Desulfuromonas sp. DDH964 TaxID=1823759 RepID=UPI00078C03EA|nr:ABC transporter ATP-binding protein [Desulfuromonas sp. DDH964]AMV71628.1 ABC transporter ATP-binding protein/permease [Desulfuromonas sp. DDH964]